MPPKLIYNYTEIDKEIRRILDEGDSWNIKLLSEKYKIPNHAIYNRRVKLGFIPRNVKFSFAYSQKEEEIVNKNLEFKNCTIVNRLAEAGFKRSVSSVVRYKYRNRLTRYGTNGLSVEDVAEGLGIDRTTVIRYMENNKLKSKKIESAAGSNPYTRKTTYNDLRNFIIKYANYIDFSKIPCKDWFIDVVAGKLK